MISGSATRPWRRAVARSFTVRVVAMALLLAAPALIFGAVFGDDIFYHVLYNTFFDQQLRAGDFYPRWLFNGNAGLGGPVFFFYGSVPSFATSVFSVFGLSVPRQLALASFVAILASGAGAYLWARMMVPKPAAAAAALLYMAHPYHLNVDLYVRFAYAEFWSFVWMPLVLASMVAIARGRRHFWLLGAVSYALLLATHPPTVLIFTCLLIPYAACLLIAAPASDRIAITARWAGTLALGIALAGIYLVPALTTQQFASYAEVLKRWDASSFIDYASSWRSGLFVAHAWRYGADPVTMLYADVAAFSLSVALVAAGIAFVRARTAAQRWWPAFWLLVVLATTVAMMPVALPFWEVARALQRIQFPTRLNFVLVLALVPLVAHAADGGPTRSRVAVVAWLLLVLYAATFWVPTAKEVRWGLDKYADAGLGAAVLPPETRPAGVPRSLAGVAAIATLGDATPRAAFRSGSGRATATAWGPGEIVIETRNERADELVVHQFNYPGWVVATTPSVTADVGASPEGLLSIRLPAGDYRLSIKRGTIAAEWIGLAMTGTATIAALVVLLFGGRGRRRPATLTS